MNKGLSLVELMVVLLLVAVIGSALFAVLSTGRTSWYSADTQISIQHELRKPMQQICDDLRQSSASKVSLPADGNTYNSVTFFVSEGASGMGAINWSSNAITYTLSSGQVVRQVGADSRILANNITALSFSRLPASSGIVRINLTAQKQSPFEFLLNSSLDSAVFLRN